MSSTTGYKFFDEFLFGYLLTSDDNALIKLREEGASRFLCFIDINKCSSAYCDYKAKDGKTLDRKLEKRKDNFKNCLEYFKDKKLLERFCVLKYANKKEDIHYQVNDNHLWDILKRYYPVERSVHMVIRNFMKKMLYAHFDNSSPLTIVNLILTLQMHEDPSSDTGLGILFI